MAADFSQLPRNVFDFKSIDQNKSPIKSQEDNFHKLRSEKFDSRIKSDNYQLISENNHNNLSYSDKTAQILHGNSSNGLVNKSFAQLNSSIADLRQTAGATTHSTIDSIFNPSPAQIQDIVNDVAINTSLLVKAYRNLSTVQDTSMNTEQKPYVGELMDRWQNLTFLTSTLSQAISGLDIPTLRVIQDLTSTILSVQDAVNLSGEGGGGVQGRVKVFEQPFLQLTLQYMSFIKTAVTTYFRTLDEIIEKNHDLNNDKTSLESIIPSPTVSISPQLNKQYNEFSIPSPFVSSPTSITDVMQVIQDQQSKDDQFNDNSVLDPCKYNEQSSNVLDQTQIIDNKAYRSLVDQKNFKSCFSKFIRSHGKAKKFLIRITKFLDFISIIAARVR